MKSVKTGYEVEIEGRRKKNIFVVVTLKEKLICRRCVHMS